MNEVGKISVGLYLNNQKFNQDVNKLPSQANAIGSKLSGIFSKIGKTIVAAFSIKAITSFTKKMVQSAAEVQAANSQFEQTFGKMADVASAAMKRVADESGIVQTRLQGVGTSIFAFAKTTGMDSASALKMMEEALKVTADSAAYYDRSLEDTAESLKAFLKGNYANDAALGLSCTETTRNTAANKLYGKSFRDLSEAQKQLTLLQMVKDANAASGALGQAARESDGLENVLGNLKEAWNQLLAVIGKPVLQGAVTVIQRITSWLVKLTTVARTAMSALSDLFGWKKDNSTELIQNAANAIDNTVYSQSELTKEVKKTTNEVKRSVASFDKLNIITKTESNSDSDDGNDNLGSIPPNLNRSIAADVQLNTDNANLKIDEMKRKFKTLLKPVVDFYNKYIKPIVNSVKTTLSEIGTKTKEWFENLDWEPLKASIGELLEKIRPLVEAILPQISYIITEVIQPVLKLVIEQILPAVISLLGHIIGFLTPIIESLFGLLVPIWENILYPALVQISEWFSQMVEEVGPVLEELGSEIGYLLEELQPLVSLLTQILGPSITAFTKVIGGSLIQGLKILIQAIGAIAQQLRGLIEIFSGLLSGDMEKVEKGLKHYFAGIINLIISIINSVWASIYTAFVSVVNSLGGLVKGIGEALGQDDWGWKLPTEAPLLEKWDPDAPPSKPETSSSGGSFSGKTYSFANGGIVSAPTLALVGDNARAGSGNPEVISPLNKLKDMMHTGNEYDTTLLVSILDYLKRLYELFITFRNNGGNTYQFVAQLDGETIFEEFVEQIRLYKIRHNGNTPW